MLNMLYWNNQKCLRTELWITSSFSIKFVNLTMCESEYSIVKQIVIFHYEYALDLPLLLISACKDGDYPLQSSSLNNTCQKNSQFAWLFYGIDAQKFFMLFVIFLPMIKKNNILWCLKDQRVINIINTFTHHPFPVCCPPPIICSYYP